MANKQSFNWLVGYSDSQFQSPDKMIPSVIPGSVQLDIMKSENMPHYNFGTNSHLYEWIENKFWHYHTDTYLSPMDNDVPFLVFESIEYESVILINKTEVIHHEGMYTPVKINLSEYINHQIEIDVIIFPAPKRPGTTRRHMEFSMSCKPPFAYGWDWSPRLIPLGICGGTYIEFLPSTRITGMDLSYELDDALTTALLKIKYSISCATSCLLFSLYNDKNICILENEISMPGLTGEYHCVLQAPDLWWPAGHGDQPVYRAVLSVGRESTGNHDMIRNLGFRRVKLIMNEGTWEDCEGFPATRCKPPITLEINGRAVFAKGSNLVPLDIFSALIQKEDYKSILLLVKNANMNILRLWGGGYINKPEFFDLCDQYGIMVWQEFPLACADYPDDKHYLTVLDQESRSIIAEIKNHPCHVIWGGGNELFNNWSKMTDQSLALRILNRNCLQEDPFTPFIPTSPLYGMGHGNYVMFDDKGKEMLSVICESKFTAYTEFGNAAPSPMEYLKTFIPEDELSEPKPGGSWENHHAFKAWQSDDDWFSSRYIKKFIGEKASSEEIINQGVYIQSLSYQYLYEEMRKQWPYCSMALNWCFNEPWPTAAGNSLVNYPAIPKPCYFTVKDALRPQKASLRITKLLWNHGETFSAGIWLLNDDPKSINAGDITVFTVFDNVEKEQMKWTHEGTAAMTNLEGPTVTFKIPKNNSKELKIILRSSDNQDLNSEYTILCCEKTSKIITETSF